jgi:hypothetical protein
MNQSLSIITILISGVAVFSSVLGCIVYPKTNIANKYFIIFLVFGTAIELLSSSWAEEGRNNLIFFHINTLIEFILLTIFFVSIYDRDKQYLLKWILPIGIFFILFNSLFIQKIDTYNTISLTTVSLYLIGCCLYYFYLAIGHRVEIYQNTFTKYAVFSIFSLHIVSLMVLFFGNFLLNVKGTFVNMIWTIRALIIFVVKLLILIQLIKMAVGYYYKKDLV